MDKALEDAVAAALKTPSSAATAGAGAAPRTLTLDGAVKCSNGRLPAPLLLERFHSLELLSLANVRLSTVEGFPRLPRLRRLVLSDNRVAGGLAALAAAGLAALRHLDLSNNRIAVAEDLAPLAALGLESLDLYECPVTRVEGYRSKVFGMIPSLKYLDKIDADGKERLDSDDEEDEEEDEETDEEEEGEGSDGEGKDEDEDDESNEDESEGEEIDEHAKDHSCNGAPPNPNSSAPNKRTRDEEDNINGKSHENSRQLNTTSG